MVNKPIAVVVGAESLIGKEIAKELISSNKYDVKLVKWRNNYVEGLLDISWEQETYELSPLVSCYKSTKLINYLSELILHSHPGTIDKLVIVPFVQQYNMLRTEDLLDEVINSYFVNIIKMCKKLVPYMSINSEIQIVSMLLSPDTKLSVQNKIQESVASQSVKALSETLNVVFKCKADHLNVGVKDIFQYTNQSLFDLPAYETFISETAKLCAESEELIYKFLELNNLSIQQKLEI